MQALEGAQAVHISKHYTQGTAPSAEANADNAHVHHCTCCPALQRLTVVIVTGNSIVHMPAFSQAVLSSRFAK